MSSFRTKIDARRQMFLNLTLQIEGQLRAAYDKKFRAGEATQTSLAAKLGINRSSVHHRLMGHTNMTMESLADMVWALGCGIKVQICEPERSPGCNYFVPLQVSAQPPANATGSMSALGSANAPVGAPLPFEKFVARAG